MDDTNAATLAAVADERPDLSLVTRTGTQIPLLQPAHRDRLQTLADSDPDMDCSPGPIGTLTADGGLVTADVGVGTWTITAHRNSTEQWLTISDPDGTAVAQRDTDLADIGAVALSMYVLWGWATVGPEVF